VGAARGPAPQPDVTAGVAYLFARRPPGCGGTARAPAESAYRVNGPPAPSAPAGWQPRL